MDIRVLHVDDREGFLDVTSRYLEKKHDEISYVGVESAEDAMEVLEDEDIDCVVSDYDMPDTDGLELLEEVRKEYPNTPFILFTSKGSEEIASEALRAGASDYVRKDSGTDTFDLLVNRIEGSVAQARAEEKIEERERRLSNLISNVPGIFYRCSDEPGWPFEFASDGCEGLTGYPAEILEKKEVLWEDDIIHPLDKERVRSEVEEGIVASETFEIEYRIVSRDDEVKWVWERGQPVGEEDGKTYLEGVISDITEMVGRETETQRYETILDAIPDGVYILDPQGYFVDLNDTITEMTGHEYDDLIGEHISKVLDEEEMKRAEEAIEGILSSEEGTVSFEGSFVNREDETVHFEVRISPLFDGDSFNGTMGVVRDVSDKRERTKKLRQLHIATRSLVSAGTPEEAAETVTEIADEVLDISTDGLFVREGDVLEPLAVSDQAEEVFAGVPELPVDDSIAGKALKKGETLRVEDVRQHGDVFDPGTPIRSEVFVPLGERAVFVAGHTQPRAFTDEDIEFAEILCSNAHAVFERLDKEEELREREEWFRNLIEYSNDIITILDETGSMIYQSPSIERIMGYEPDENLGESAFDWVHPDDRAELAKLFTESIGKDEPIRTGEYRLKHKDGSWRYIESIGTDRTDDPAVGGIVINSRDVTERVEHERELERQNERLEKFASIVSHDLRNPLSIARGSIEIARDSDAPDEHLERAEGSLERMEKMFEDILTLNREGESVESVEEIDIEEVARSAWDTFGTEDAKLEFGDTGTVEAEEGRLVRLLGNLFRNSVEHGGEQVTVTVGMLEDGSGFYVKDDGEGILPVEKDEVFDYGYTTAEDGTGIGLSIVETIANAHGWEINLTESDEGGARFEFRTDTTDSV